MPRKDESQMTLLELCDRFTKDIEFGAHGIEIEVGRSIAGKRLIKEGKEHFSDIIQYLRSHSASFQYGSMEGWCRLLWRIGRQQGRLKQTAPDSWTDWEVWVAWIEA